VLSLLRVQMAAAQDNPLASISDIRTGTVSSIASSRNASAVVLTGQVRVVRDDADYRVKGIIFLADDGNVYNVTIDNEGRKLLRVLKSKIMRVEGQVRESGGEQRLVVKRSEIIGSTKKTEADAATGMETNVATIVVSKAGKEVATNMTVNIVSNHPAVLPFGLMTNVEIVACAPASTGVVANTCISVTNMPAVNEFLAAGTNTVTNVLDQMSVSRPSSGSNSAEVVAQ